MKYQDHRIFTKHSRSTFLHFEYPYQGKKSFRKIKAWAGTKENEKVINDSTHYLEYPDLRLWCFEILKGLEVGQELVSYKGFTDESGKTVSRLMKVKRAPDDKDGEKYLVIVGHGPGIERNGIIMPKPKAPKEAWIFTPMPFSKDEITAFALEMQAWLNAIINVEAMDLYYMEQAQQLEESEYTMEGGSANGTA